MNAEFKVVFYDALASMASRIRNVLTRIRNKIKTGDDAAINAQAPFFAQIALDSAMAAESLYHNAGQCEEAAQMCDIRIALAKFVSAQNDKHEARRQFEIVLQNLLHPKKRHA